MMPPLRAVQTPRGKHSGSVKLDLDSDVTENHMESNEHMADVNRTQPTRFSASIKGTEFTEDQVRILGEALARRVAEKQVRDIILDHARRPLGRLAKQLGKAHSLIIRAYIHGR